MTMSKDYNYIKSTWITGASGGIGGAIAQLLAQNGAAVALQYCTGEQRAKELAHGIREQGGLALPVYADVTQPKTIRLAHEAITAELGAPELLVYSAGIAQQKLFCDISGAEFERMFAVHVTGAFHCIQAVLPEMIRRKQGKIILISSMWGTAGASCEVHYSAAKAAQHGLAKALAKELAPSNIQVNCIAPGVIDTAMNNFPEETMRQLREESPMGRFGTPQEVAALVQFLASDAADFITGQIIGIDGGFM